MSVFEFSFFSIYSYSCVGVVVCEEEPGAAVAQEVQLQHRPVIGGSQVQIPGSLGCMSKHP